MKRKFAIGLLSVTVAGGIWSCFTQAQDPITPGRAARVQTMRTVNVDGHGEVVNVFGVSPDVPATGLALFQGEASNLNGNVAMLADQLKSTQKTEERESILTKLKTAVGEQFDARQDAKTKELKALEEQLIKLKELHAKRSQQRDQIVADRVQQIVKEADGLGWGTSDVLESTSLFGSPAAARSYSRGGQFGASGPRYVAPAATMPAAPAAPPAVGISTRN